MIAGEATDQHPPGEDDDTRPRQGLAGPGDVDEKEGAPVEWRAFNEHRKAAGQHQSEGETAGPLSLATTGSGFRDQTCGVQGGTQTDHRDDQKLDSQVDPHQDRQTR